MLKIQKRIKIDNSPGPDQILEYCGKLRKLSSIAMGEVPKDRKVVHVGVSDEGCRANPGNHRLMKLISVMHKVVEVI